MNKYATKLLYLLFILLVSSCGRVNIEQPVINDGAAGIFVGEDDKQEQEQQQEQQQEQKLSLVMLGDALLHKAVYTDAETQVVSQDGKKQQRLMTSLICCNI